MPSSTVRFAGYPAPWVYENPDTKSPKVQQLLWGDWLLCTDQTENGFRLVEKARNSTGWVREELLEADRLLAIDFVDVGQGDGCFIVTPKDHWILVDAGEAQDMFWYLRWRFNLRNRAPDKPPLRIDQAIITHPDQDHYGGFGAIIDSPQLTIGTLFHNGIIERAGDDRLGQLSPDGKTLTEIVADKPTLAKLLADDKNVGKLAYPKLMRKALASSKVDDIAMLSTLNSHVPGFETGDLIIEVLGPAPEAGAKLGLKKLGDTGVTKNGHSVTLKIRYHDLTVSLGGDLNVPAQHHLVAHHTDIEVDALPKDPDDPAYRTALASARGVFRADIAKACHHGSSDIDNFFLRSTDAIATMVSSGDNEPHFHPRPDALGAIGKFGRGDRPLIFSTELGRSTAKFKPPEAYRRERGDEIDAALSEVIATGQTDAENDDEVVANYQRAIAVYGTITLRSDGHRVLIAQKLEGKRSAAEFQYYCLEPGPDGLTWNPKAGG